MVRVLVVEDEANIRDMIALNLRHAGMEVVEAESAEAALPLLASPARTTSSRAWWPSSTAADAASWS